MIAKPVRYLLVCVIAIVLVCSGAIMLPNIWARSRISAISLEMTEAQVQAAIGPARNYGINVMNGFPWPSFVGLSVLRGQIQVYRRVDRYWFGLNEYWIYFDDQGRVCGVAEAFDS